MWANLLRILIPVVGGWIGSDLADLYKTKGSVPTVPEVKETFGGNLAKYGIIAGFVLILGFLGFTFFKETTRKRR